VVELQPEYVKIDMHFVQGINHDPMKLQFVRSIQEIAEKSGSIVIAEGIESQAELLTIRDLGIACGQGYHISRPLPEPPVSISEDVSKTLRRDKVPLSANKYGPGKRSATVAKLLRETQYVSPEVTNDAAYDMFVNDPQLQALPVVSNGLPIGLINRYSMVERFARLYGRELYGKKSCAFFMDPNPILTEQDTSLQDLSNLLVHAESHHLSNGFIITDRGQYVGLGTGHDLLREITQMQIDAARHANPLTQLPGNVPINDHIEYLLQSGVEFCICYCDLDQFKPFNDVYGYRKGDDMIQATGRVLQQACDPPGFHRPHRRRRFPHPVPERGLGKALPHHPRHLRGRHPQLLLRRRRSAQWLLHRGPPGQPGLPPAGVAVAGRGEDRAFAILVTAPDRLGRHPRQEAGQEDPGQQPLHRAPHPGHLLLGLKDG
jgi:CBS domain-containing protein